MDGPMDVMRQVGRYAKSDGVPRRSLMVALAVGTITNPVILGRLPWSHMPKQFFCRARGGPQMGAQITKTDFTGQLVTIRSKKSFVEVTVEIERLFQRYDLDKLRQLTAAGDAKELAAYAKRVGEPTGFG